MRSIGRRRFMIAGSAMAAAGLVLTACSSSTSPSSSSSTSGSSSASASMPAGCEAYSAYMGHEGTTVTMFGSILSPESDSLNRSWAEFQQVHRHHDPVRGLERLRVAAPRACPGRSGA